MLLYRKIHWLVLLAWCLMTEELQLPWLALNQLTWLDGKEDTLNFLSFQGHAAMKEPFEIPKRRRHTHIIWELFVSTSNYSWWSRKSRIYFGTLGKKTMTMKRPRLKVFFRRRKSNFQLWRRRQWRKLILITKITLYLDSSSSSSSVYLCKIWYFTLSLLASVSRKPNAMKINLFRAKQQLRLYSYDTGRCIWVFSSCIFAMTYYWTWSIAYCPS